MKKKHLAVLVSAVILSAGTAYAIGLPGISSGGLCLPPLCVGDPSEPLSLGPVTLPEVPSLPLPPLSPPPVSPPPPNGCASVTLGMKVLVLSADGNESVLASITQALDYHSIPNIVWIASQQPGALTADALATGCSGNYQAVILTTGALAYSPDGISWVSALSNAEWQALRNYEANFRVREIAWYVYPDPSLGLNPPTGSGSEPIDATLTAAGRAAFPDINAANPIPIRNAWTYRATAADATVTPLLVDAAGNALVSSRQHADGRESIAMTFDSNPSLLHNVVLAHGLVEWVTRGVYLGEFRVYLTPQVDDVYLTTNLYGGGTYRMVPEDVTAMHLWQTSVQTVGGNPQFRLAHAFNGSEAASDDPLTLSLAAVNGSYHFINHSWSHEDLNGVPYSVAFSEIDLNDRFGKDQGFLSYFTQSIVTPKVSGLDNPEAMRAAKDVGVRYTVSDTSRTGWNNPRPNIGIYSVHEPAILHIPRRPTNLFYNVDTPARWEAEYNSLYASYWGRNLTYAEILDKESELLLFYMLRGDLDPQMYHQANLRAYDGVHSLLSDLHDMAIAKLRRHSNLPLRSPDMHVAGRRMADTMARDAAGVTATLQPGASVSLTSPVAVRFAVSGVCASDSETYAGKCITTVSVPAGGTVTLPMR